MELAFPLGSMVAALGGGAVLLWAVHSHWASGWASRRRAPSPLAAAAWQWCLVFITAVAALMLAHVTAFGLTVPGVTRVIGDLGVVWGSERWSDALAFALDPVAAALLVGPTLLVAVTAFVDTARLSPPREHRVRSVAMTLALAGLACLVMARSSGGLLAGWITVGAASLLAASPAASSAARQGEATTLDATATGWAGLVRREIAACVAIAVAGANVAWVMPSWAFDPLALAAATGEDSLLRQAGPFGAPVAETITVAIAVAALLRLAWWPTTIRAPAGPSVAMGEAATTTAASSSNAASSEATLDALAVIRDVSAIAVLVRYDVVAALAPVPLGVLGVIAALGALVGAARLVWSESTRGGAARHVDFRPATSAVALLAIASFVPELAVAVVVLAGATWWMVRRVPPEVTIVDDLLRWFIAPLPMGLGLALAATTLATWTHVSAFSPLFNVVAAVSCLVVGMALAIAAASRPAARSSAASRLSVESSAARTAPEEGPSREARRAGQVLIALVIPTASVLVVPMPGGSPLSRAFASHVAIPRGLTGVFAVGPARGWGDTSFATWSTFGVIVTTLLVATVWARWLARDTSPSRGRASDAPPASSSSRPLAFASWLDVAPVQGFATLTTRLRGGGAALEFGVGRVASRDFVALASDELDRASIASSPRHRLRAGLGLVAVLALVLGAIFGNRGASSFTPDGLFGFPGLRARIGVSDESSPPAATRPRDEASASGRRGGR